jgi:hypothetical protein
VSISTSSLGSVGTKALPKSLEEVRGALSLQAGFQWDEKGRPLDGWGRPFLYSTDGAKFVITSLGRDGKPGGLGLDCDLSTTNTWPAEYLQSVLSERPDLHAVLGTHHAVRPAPASPACERRSSPIL